ncbi:MAG: T9SS type A sorting domain-containing protein [Bacteroidetes bacterium]|nr:T9SS type A sorting domain-containing protein [Bacteroidota bacterium]
MKKIIAFNLMIISIIFSVSAQVTFMIDSLPDYTPPDDILYIAGDFQGWNPGDPAYALQKNAQDQWYIQLDSMAAGTQIEFKFTRGDWGTVEKGVYGEEIPNREFTYGNGDTVGIIIYNWADAGGGGNSTAAENVHIIDEEFYIPQLDKHRRIWIYLPPDYETTSHHYPVIYMHDGQNLFDTYTAFAGEWEVDETLNELYDDSYAVPIVVGIDNGGVDRIDEYTPWPNSQYGGGDGDLYIQFIVGTLKPFIDENYRTLPDRENTALWGSSLGGLISHYGAMKHQDVFSKAGIYSPSYWFSDSVWTFTEQMGHQQTMRLYQMTGSLEGSGMVTDTWTMHDQLTELGFGEEELLTTIITGGEHNEASWAADFRDAYLWLFQSWANGVGDHYAIQQVQISPNPARNQIRIPEIEFNQSSLIRIYDQVGREQFENYVAGNEAIDVSKLDNGIYFIIIINNNNIYNGKFIKE